MSRVLATEPRFAATLARIEDEIITDGPGVHRYRSDTYYGGGAWPVLTSAYGRVLLRRDDPGDLERALEALRWIEAQADQRGELPEQVADHAFAPERIDEWRESWGESARPLLWSHAAYLSLAPSWRHGPTWWTLRRVSRHRRRVVRPTPSLGPAGRRGRHRGRAVGGPPADHRT